MAALLDSYSQEEKTGYTHQRMFSTLQK